MRTWVSYEGLPAGRGEGRIKTAAIKTVFFIFWGSRGGGVCALVTLLQVTSTLTAAFEGLTRSQVLKN